MHRSPKARTLALLALVVLALAGLTLPVAVSAAEAEETHETVAQYEQNLASGQVANVTVNKFLARLHVTLKDGTHVLIRYHKGEEPKVVSLAQARHVPVTILKSSAAKAEAKKVPVHHKLRYIAGGILIAVIVVVGAVILIDRRRKAAVE